MEYLLKLCFDVLAPVKVYSTDNSLYALTFSPFRTQL